MFAPEGRLLRASQARRAFPTQMANKQGTPFHPFPVGWIERRWRGAACHGVLRDDVKPRRLDGPKRRSVDSASEVNRENRKSKRLAGCQAEQRLWREPNAVIQEHVEVGRVAERMRFACNQPLSSSPDVFRSRLGEHLSG